MTDTKQHDPFDVAELVADANERGEDPLQAVVFTALGAASVCWDNMAGAGVFDSDRAKEIGDAVVAWLRTNPDPNTGMPIILPNEPEPVIEKTWKALDTPPGGCGASTVWHGPGSDRDHVHVCTKEEHRPNERHHCACGSSWLTREVG